MKTLRAILRVGFALTTVLFASCTALPQPAKAPQAGQAKLFFLWKSERRAPQVVELSANGSAIAQADDGIVIRTGLPLGKITLETRFMGFLGFGLPRGRMKIETIPGETYYVVLGTRLQNGVPIVTGSAAYSTDYLSSRLLLVSKEEFRKAAGALYE